MTSIIIYHLHIGYLLL